MLKQNQNRGAGLVTVVTVLAVCSILLAGVVALSFNHYKNAIRQTQSRDELAEIELFAEIVNEALKTEIVNSETVFTDFPEPSLLSSFYDVSTVQNMVFEKISVSVQAQVYTVTCGNTSRKYHFTDEKFVPYEPSVEGGNNEA